MLSLNICILCAQTTDLTFHEVTLLTKTDFRLIQYIQRDIFDQRQNLLVEYRE
jgi:hypothetical protein